ncbi:hypothetical protein PQO01_09020 [Lentisphaera marina]|uniref:hypothetical protein n=1 Tax=Lentisphaera marina TaxID=1111041 RepID=UPI002365CD10|nr:hypothetical protein [Lentisphaera marina]MDD7985088.1 hypothetical protein [Lentisphaera marina]
MNRRLFLLATSVCLMSTSALAKKKKKGKRKGKGGGNNDELTKEAKGSMTGTFTLKDKKHEADRDDYIFTSGGKTYTVSRNIYDEVEGKLDSSVTIECKVINENCIIAIKSIN